MTQKFPVKGTIPDQEYDKLILEKAKDRRGNNLVIGDYVAYAVSRRGACPVSISPIKDIILNYSGHWVGGPARNGGKWEPNYTSINCEIKLNRVRRFPSYIVKVV